MLICLELATEKSTYTSSALTILLLWIFEDRITNTPFFETTSLGEYVRPE